FLKDHPKVQFHFTPTYSSWLNQWSFGLRRSSATSLRAESSRRSPTWLAKYASTSAHMPSQPSLSAGPIPIPLAGSPASDSTVWIATRARSDNPKVGHQGTIGSISILLRLRETS